MLVLLIRFCLLVCLLRLIVADDLDFMSLICVVLVVLFGLMFVLWLLQFGFMMHCLYWCVWIAVICGALVFCFSGVCGLVLLMFIAVSLNCVCNGVVAF